MLREKILKYKYRGLLLATRQHRPLIPRPLGWFHCVPVFCLRHRKVYDRANIFRLLHLCSFTSSLRASVYVRVFETVFTARRLCSRGMAMSDPSVRLSIKRADCDKTKETSVQILKPCVRSMRLFLRHEEWMIGDIPFYLKFWAKLTHPLQKRRFPIDIRS